MPNRLREAWTGAVKAEDYEAHMAAIGQAQANAGHIQDFIANVAPPGGARVLIAGAGTGQMFEFLSPRLFDGLKTCFCDINPAFLARLRERYRKACCVADDLECSCLQGPFFGAAAVLVLEHIDWRKGLDTLAGLEPAHLFLVIQRNPPGMATAVTPTRTPPGTMRVFTEAHPVLLDPDEVTAYLAVRGYSLKEAWPREVLDSKVMLGLRFERTT